MEIIQKIKTLDAKQRKRLLTWGALALLVLLLAVMPMLAAGNDASGSQQASILSATADYQDIETRIIGGGQLSSEAAIRLKIPEEVKLTQYLVGNGDTVSEGDAIAAVDKISVMTAIAGVQETLDDLADEIASASDDQASQTVSALAGGTVKKIYAAAGEPVQDVMLEHGALAVLSLDDTMAVQLETDSALTPGDTVDVILSGGTQVDGRVKSNLNGVLTVTIEDNDYAIGTPVTVKTQNGQRLGTGELYVTSAWNATAYSGTVSSVLVNEGATVYVGQSLLQLEDSGHTAEYQRLVDRRHEYEELMQELFKLYRTETITAPCDGIVTGVDKDGAYLLAEHGGSWFASFLSFFSRDEGFVAYSAKVVSASGGTMELLMNPDPILVDDMAGLSAVSADIPGMTHSWSYSGDTKVYIQDENGLLLAAGEPKAGDILLVVGDEESVHWFILLKGSDETAAAAQAKPAQSGLVASLLSSEEAPDEVCTPDGENTQATVEPVEEELVYTGTDSCTGMDGCTASSHNDGCPMKPSVLTDCTGQADCTAEAHDPGCLSLCDLSANCPAANHKEGCLSQQPAPPAETGVRIATESLNQGIVNQSYLSPLQATDGTNVLDGTWSAIGLPDGLSIDTSSGIISGTPAAAGSVVVHISFACTAGSDAKDFTLTVLSAPAQTVYQGYLAQVTEVADGTMKVMQTAYSYSISDLNALPTVSVDTNAMTVERVYTSELVSTASLAVGDVVLVIVDGTGSLIQIAEPVIAPGGGSLPDGGAGGMPSGGMQGGGMTGMSGMPGGTAQTAGDTLYSLNKLTVASVTSQEHMRLAVTVDELDISKIYVGQPATVSVDALAGESFSATVSTISNSGTNEGGNSKFTVELTLEKSGEMLPGMSASASIVLSIAENVLCVPVAALDEVNGETVLYTGCDEKSTSLTGSVPVTIGVADAEYVQILDGLREGDTVFYAYFDTVESEALPSKGTIPLGNGE